MWRSSAKLAVPMLIFGSIGVFVRGIPLATVELVFYRVFIASLFILGLTLLRGERPFRCGRRELLLGGASGVVMGANWVLFFQALRYTTVAAATMTYYLAPVLALLLAPRILGERLTRGQVLAALPAPLGLALIVWSSTAAPQGAYRHGLGLLCGLGSAVFYAALILCNKKLSGVGGLDRTLIQLLAAALVLSPILLWHHDFGAVLANLPMLLVLGVVHTGVACHLYFAGLRETPSQLTAVLSYLDPVSAVFFAAAFLGEPLNAMELLGTGVVLLSTYLCTRQGSSRPGYTPRGEG